MKKKILVFAAALCSLLNTRDAKAEFELSADYQEYCPEVECGEFFIDSELIFWKPLITGMFYAATHTPEPFPPFLGGGVADNLTLQNVSFDIAPGGSLSVGYIFPNSAWEINIGYLYFNTSASAEVHMTDSTRVDNLWESVAFLIPISAASNFRINYQSVEILIGKEFSVTKRVDFLPFIGFHTYDIDLREKINSFGTIEFTTDTAQAIINLQNESRGNGLKTGFDFICNLPYSLGLYGHLSYSLFVTNFKLANKQILTDFVDPANNLDLKTTNHIQSLKHHFELEIGAQWDRSFCYDRFNLLFHIGFILDYWPTHVQIVRIIPIDGVAISGGSDIFIAGHGDIGFYGLTAGVQLRF